MAKQFNFTGQAVDRIKPPKTGRDEYRDTRCGNLYLRVTSKAAKSYCWFGRVHGKLKRITIGSCDDLKPAQAREAAEAITGSKAMGEDPHADRKQKRTELTLGDASDLWMQYSRTHKRRWLKDEKRIARYFKQWSHRRLSDITREDARKLHARIAEESGPAAANDAIVLLSAIYRRMKRHHDHRGDNPTEAVDKLPQPSRERFMTRDELKRFFAAVDGLESKMHADYFRLLIFTGARRGNVEAMQWTELNLTEKTWTIPASKAKSKRTMSVPLSDDALEILTRRQKTSNGSPWVFPSYTMVSHISRPKYHWRLVVKAADLHDLHIHDLRRTLGSILAQQGFSLHLIGKILGHTNPSSTQIYARFLPSNLADAVNLAGDFMRAAAKS